MTRIPYRFNEGKLQTNMEAFLTITNILNELPEHARFTLFTHKSYLIIIFKNINKLLFI